MQKWEYLAVRFNNPTSGNRTAMEANGKDIRGWPSEYEALNKLGSDGWELILAKHEGQIYVFKRPKE